jgi:predicted DNA-binding protein (UPF0251 family)
MNCKDICKQCAIPCEETNCRQWINYEEDLNCCLVAVDKHGDMTLREVADRLGISFVRVQQIHKTALKKMAKKIRFQNIL